MFWRVVMWPLFSGAQRSTTLGERVHLVRRDAAERELDPDHLDVGLALAVHALLEAEADELVLRRLPREVLLGLVVEVVELALDDRDDVARDVLADLRIGQRPLAATRGRRLHRVKVAKGDWVYGYSPGSRDASRSSPRAVFAAPARADETLAELARPTWVDALNGRHRLRAGRPGDDARGRRRARAGADRDRRAGSTSGPVRAARWSPPTRAGATSTRTTSATAASAGTRGTAAREELPSVWKGRLAFVRDRRLWVRPIGGGRAREVRGGRGDYDSLDLHGRRVAFTRVRFPGDRTEWQLLTQGGSGVARLVDRAASGLLSSVEMLRPEVRGRRDLLRRRPPRRGRAALQPLRPQDPPPARGRLAPRDPQRRLRPRPLPVRADRLRRGRLRPLLRAGRDGGPLPAEALGPDRLPLSPHGTRSRRRVHRLGRAQRPPPEHDPSPEATKVEPGTGDGSLPAL